MANEDSRHDSAVGSALKIAAVGAAVYGGYKGGRGLIKNYDDLGGTFLGKTGGKMSDGIKKGLSKLDNDKGGNAIKEGLDKVQSKILDNDLSSGIKKMDRNLGKEGLELSNENYKSIHDSYKAQSTPGGKRSELKGLREDLDDIKESRKAFTESGGEGSFKDVLMADEGLYAEKGTRAASARTASSVVNASETQSVSSASSDDVRSSFTTMKL